MNFIPFVTFISLLPVVFTLKISELQSVFKSLVLKSIAQERYKTYILPDVETFDPSEASLPMEYLQLNDEEDTSSSKRPDILAIPKAAYTPHTTEKGSMKKQGPSTSQWGEFSCCRRALGIQTRERMMNSRYVQVQPRDCSWNYCDECSDIMSICESLRDFRDACSESSNFRGFMSRRCPQTCGWCDASSPNIATRSPLTTTPSSTPTTSNKDRVIQKNLLRQVQVYVKRSSVSVYDYRFTSSVAPPPFPWKQASRSIHDEVSSFFLYRRPVGKFRMPIRFCTAGRGNRQKWRVFKGPCRGGWRMEMVLFASPTSLPNTERLLVGNRGRSPWNGRIFKTRACCGYLGQIWDFYAPTIDTSRPRVKSTASRKSTTTARTGASSSTSSKNHRLSTYESECLDYHNYFRAMHGAPRLQWEPSLVETAQKWADFLAENAPRNPFQLKPGVKPTQNWPHSNKGTEYRKRGVGENIAWDFSPSGSSAHESILRWYKEIFDYDNTNPMHVERGKPIGHYTQMLWRGSNYVGCAVAVKNITITRPTYSVTFQSTYSVAHYAPAGNVVFRRRSQTMSSYTTNVPSPKPGTCMSPKSCSVHGNASNHCMGFNSNMRCGCENDASAGPFRGRPRCAGEGGCMVSCSKPPAGGRRRAPYIWQSECQGERTCECVYTPRNGRAGAICT